MNLAEYLTTHRLILDGAMGSMLQKYGLQPGQGGESANLTNKQAVMRVHGEYLQAGANIITANTFGAYSHHYDNWEELVTAGISLAREAVRAFSGSGENVVSGKNAGGSPHLVALDMGPTGKLLKPVGDADFDECYEIFKQTALAGILVGADLAIIETMTDLYELKAAVLAVKDARESGAAKAALATRAAQAERAAPIPGHFPIIATVSFDANGYTMMGSSVENMAVLLESLGVDALGMNCGFGPDVFAALLPALTAVTNLPIVLQPNAGLPEIVDGQTIYSLSPNEFAEIMAGAAAEPAVRILGGCCGTTPEHIRAMAQAAERVPVKRGKPRTRRTVSLRSAMHFATAPRSGAAVSSAARVVWLDSDFSIGKSALSAESDLDERIDEACDLAEEYDIVEVFLRTPEEVLDFQEAVHVPLCLRAEGTVLERAARLYNGVAMGTREDRSAECFDIL